jgi:hypothetical protein
MMEAVARRKANWLFDARSEKVFFGKRRPQEDMVTSAIFGSIRLMSPQDRRAAIKILLGTECFEAAGFPVGVDIDISLWRRIRGLKGRRHVEPDVLLSCQRMTLIVEVKWHAQLSEQQIEQQIEAVGSLPGTVTAVVLGEAGVEKKVCNIPCFRRTWRDVSGELQPLRGRADQPLDRWVETVYAFLQQTDMGSIFAGLAALTDPGEVTFRFRKPVDTP